jgi:SAM-dependent methyltransferase
VTAPRRGARPAPGAPAAVPVVVAPADALPLATGTVDAAMALLSVHHWRDVRAGLRELRRVARHVAVVFTIDPAQIGGFWLVRDYLPEIVALDRPRFPALSLLRYRLIVAPLQ